MFFIKHFRSKDLNTIQTHGHQPPTPGVSADWGDLDVPPKPWLFFFLVAIFLAPFQVTNAEWAGSGVLGRWDLYSSYVGDGVTKKGTKQDHYGTRTPTKTAEKEG